MGYNIPLKSLEIIGEKMKFEELTEKIIGCAYRVYNTMDSGYLESVYEKCFLIELEKNNLHAEAQKPIVVYYQGIEVGNFIADIIVDKKIIIEIKAIKQLIKTHEVQLVNYLTATGIDVGLLVNFSNEKIEIKRKVRKLENQR